MHVWHLLATMLREGETPEQTAKNYGLPVEAVLEALDYYQRNKSLVEEERSRSQVWMSVAFHSTMCCWWCSRG